MPMQLTSVTAGGEQYATAGMFVGEYLVRYRLHPEFERVGLHQAWRAYQGRPAVALDSSRAALDP